MANNNEKIIDNDDDDLLCQLASTMDDNNVNIYKKEEENEEQCLSQKLSQLSASEDDHQNKQSKDSTTTTMMTTNKRSSVVDTSTIPKKMKIDDQKVHDEEMKDKIPNYLSINHQDFQQLIQSILSTTANSMNMKDLQEIALLLRQMTMIDLQISLWNSYLQSGTGELAKEHRLSTTHRHHPELFLWPIEMKSIIMKEKEKKKSDDEMIPININEIDHETCLNYVDQTLGQFVDRKIQYQTQLHEKKDAFRHFFTSKMEDAINQFIEQQEMVFIRLEFESKIAIVKYDYRDRLLELEYHQLKPNHYQLNLFENLIRVKQEKEKSKYEVEMLKQRQLHHSLPEPLNSLQLPFPLPPSSLDTITDQKSRENLLDRYKKIIEQTKSEMMALYITIAEAKMHECQLKFAQDTVQMRPDQRSTTTETRLSPSMINIVEQRFTIIDERLQYLYTLKIRFLQEQTKKENKYPWQSLESYEHMI